MSTAGALAVAFAVAAAVWLTAPNPAGARMRSIVEPPVAKPAPPVDDRARRWLRRLAPLCAGMAIWSVVGGWVGVALAVVAVLLTPRALARLGSAKDRAQSVRIVADLPTAAGLMAACLRSGRAVPDAVRSVAAALGGPLGGLLDEVATGLDLGASPAAAWAPLTRHRATASIGRAFVRSLESGAPVSDAMDRLAEAARHAARAAAVERARAVGVQAALPLGLCFLPAFVAVGLVPVIVSALSSVIASLR